jgi:hypothetical protein
LINLILHPVYDLQASIYPILIMQLTGLQEQLHIHLLDQSTIMIIIDPDTGITTTVD